MPLIETLGVGFALAFLFGLAAARMRLPPIVGYLLAGVAIGPFTPGFAADADLAAQLAEVGIILLMFGVGFHFSLRDLMAVKGVAVPGAIGQIIIATSLGAALGVMWGWPLRSSITFGLALSVASTVVLLRLLDENGVLTSLNGRIAVGWLIVEDLVMVMALVLLPAFGTEQSGGGAGSPGGGDLALTIAITVGKVAAFAAVMLLLGARVLPWLLGVVARTGSRELFTLSVLAVTVGVAYASAELFGVSLALGAFFAGVVISESDLSHRAAAESMPLQDAFAVLFFVSVGMLFDPGILAERPGQVTAVIAIVILGKSLFAAAIVLMLNYPLRTALMVSVSLAQIGEFSFILAALGVALNLLPGDGQDLLLAAALVSITLNPLVFRTLMPLMRWLDRHPRIVALLERSNASLQSLADEPHAPLTDHAVIVGYGRIGRVLAEAFQRSDRRYAVVDYDRHIIEQLRRQGVPAIYGNAGTSGILAAAGVAEARVILVTTPDALQARQVIDVARRLHPDIRTIVGTHSESELAWLERHEIGFAIMGETEMAASMARYALEALEVDERDARNPEVEVRDTATAGVAADEKVDSGKPVPELR